MPFPDSPRVKYQRNPLIEVICQLNFPAVLRIDSELPTGFQERLRERFPIFSEEQAATLQIGFPGLSAPPPVKQHIRPTRSVYRFLTEDKKWTVTLSRDSLALSTKAYTSWEEFRDSLLVPFQALIDEYKPAFFIRLGLRYRNVIDRGQLGLTGVPWNTLLKPHVAGELAIEALAPKILSSVNQVNISLDDQNNFVLINHGLVTNEASNRPEDFSYLIDNDFSTTETTEVNDAIDRLNYFNKFSGRLFQWCISEKLHDALGPDSITK